MEALCENFFRYLERPVFPGGCFFASATAELDTHPGPVKEKLVESLDGWLALIERRAREAQEAGELDASEDPALLAFELDAFMKMGNSLRVLHGGRSGLAQARAAVRDQARASPCDEAVRTRPQPMRVALPLPMLTTCPGSRPSSRCSASSSASCCSGSGSKTARPVLVADPVRTPGVLNPDVTQATIDRDDLQVGLDAHDPSARRVTRTS